jgi:hypothetical protein
VPAAGKIIDVVTPVPSGDPLEFVHEYEQGEALQVDLDASKLTGEPVTGDDGLYVNAAVGGGM